MFNYLKFELNLVQRFNLFSEASAVLATGQHSRHSVLDKVVPGYYHRRIKNGEICMSTCCNNTASEHAMCERLVLDDMVHWARNYKVATPVTAR